MGQKIIALQARIKMLVSFAKSLHDSPMYVDGSTDRRNCCAVFRLSNVSFRDNIKVVEGLTISGGALWLVMRNRKKHHRHS